MSREAFDPEMHARLALFSQGDLRPYAGQDDLRLDMELLQSDVDAVLARADSSDRLEAERDLLFDDGIRKGIELAAAREICVQALADLDWAANRDALSMPANQARLRLRAVVAYTSSEAQETKP